MQGQDYTVSSSTTALTFRGGVNDGHSECIQIDIIEDNVYEQQEQFRVFIPLVTSVLPLLALEQLITTYTLEDNTGPSL